MSWCLDRQIWTPLRLRALTPLRIYHHFTNHIFNEWRQISKQDTLVERAAQAKRLPVVSPLSIFIGLPRLQAGRPGNENENEDTDDNEDKKSFRAHSSCLWVHWDLTNAGNFEDELDEVVLYSLIVPFIVSLVLNSLIHFSYQSCWMWTRRSANLGYNQRARFEICLWILPMLL